MGVHAGFSPIAGAAAISSPGGVRLPSFAAGFEASADMESILQVTRNLSMHAVASGSMEANISGVGQLAANFAATGTLDAEISIGGDLPFDIVLRTGTGANETIETDVKNVNAGSIVWSLPRNAADRSHWFDTVSGPTWALEPQDTETQREYVQTLTGFTADGYSLGTDARTNDLGTTYVDYVFKESVDNGFDIVSYTGTGSNLAVPHNLGVVPDLIFVKSTNLTKGWITWHADIPIPNYYLVLNTTGQKANTAGMWSGDPTATDFHVGVRSETNQNASTYMAYCFTSVSGISKFGSYTGNASASGPSITGLDGQGRFVFIKRTDAPGSWYIIDRDRGNVYLTANAAMIETSATFVSFTADGFDIVSDDVLINASGGNYVYGVWV